MYPQFNLDEIASASQDRIDARLESARQHRRLLPLVGTRRERNARRSAPHIWYMLRRLLFVRGKTMRV